MIWNVLRFALHIFSGKIILNFAILENLRIFQNCLFTGGVVAANGIYSAAFCESAALRESGLALSVSSLRSLPPLPKGEALAWRESFWLNRKACGCARSPLGELSRSD